jgi:Integrase core domain
MRLWACKAGLLGLDLPCDLCAKGSRKADQPAPFAALIPRGTESFADSFKTEHIRDSVWRTRTQLALAIVQYVAWNDLRLHESLGDLPPGEFEEHGLRDTV